jgi:hypothetical protein
VWPETGKTASRDSIDGLIPLAKEILLRNNMSKGMLYVVIELILTLPKMLISVLHFFTVRVLELIFDIYIGSHIQNTTEKVSTATAEFVDKGTNALVDGFASSLDKKLGFGLGSMLGGAVKEEVEKVKIGEGLVNAVKEEAGVDPKKMATDKFISEMFAVKFMNIKVASFLIRFAACIFYVRGFIIMLEYKFNMPGKILEKFALSYWIPFDPSFLFDNPLTNIILYVFNWIPGFKTVFNWATWSFKFVFDLSNVFTAIMAWLIDVNSVQWTMAKTVDQSNLGDAIQDGGAGWVKQEVSTEGKLVSASFWKVILGACVFPLLNVGLYYLPLPFGN